jgi:hypothetical protein
VRVVDAAHLWMFFGLVFSIVILPGMGMVATFTVVEGWRR